MARKMASRSVRLARVRKGVKADPKRFKATRSRTHAITSGKVLDAAVKRKKAKASAKPASRASAAPANSQKVGSDAKNIKERQRQESAVNVGRDRK